MVISPPIMGITTASVNQCLTFCGVKAGKLHWTAASCCRETRRSVGCEDWSVWVVSGGSTAVLKTIFHLRSSFLLWDELAAPSVVWSDLRWGYAVQMTAAGSQRRLIWWSAYGCVDRKVAVFKCESHQFVVVKVNLLHSIQVPRMVAVKWQEIRINLILHLQTYS